MNEQSKEGRAAGPGLMTREQACEFLNVSATTLKRLEGLRRFRRFKDGKLVRYRREELEKYVESRTAVKR